MRLLATVPLLLALSSAAHEIVKRAHNVQASNVRMRGDDPTELVKRDGSKYVFMHHIVGNTYLYKPEDWENDIIQIAARGVDALALNIGNSEWQKPQVQAAYDAAAKVAPGFKLFISFDFTEMPCDVGDTINRVNAVAGHSAQFKVNGKPMISSYSGGDFGNAGWAAIKSGTGGFIMPFLWGLEENFGSWPSLDSWYCWGCAWSQKDQPKNLDDDRYYLNQLPGRFATTVSGWFYAGYSWKNEILRSDEWLINTRWEQLMEIRSQITYIELVTWNDWGESDYFYELTPGTSQPEGTYWAEGFPHTAWYDMSAYYISAFKNGFYPAITEDVIYYWSKPHPAWASAPGNKPNHADWVQGQDFLWAVVFATAPADVTLALGSSSSATRVAAGVTKLKVACAPGRITVKMAKASNGVVVINKTPTDFEYTNTPARYNYNAYVGSAKSPAVAGTPPVTPEPTPTPTPSTSSWKYAGCYLDPNSPRVLNGGNTFSNTQTVEKCLASCKAVGFAYGGLEYKSECWCGSAITADAQKTSES